MSFDTWTQARVSNVYTYSVQSFDPAPRVQGQGWTTIRRKILLAVRYTLPSSGQDLLERFHNPRACCIYQS